MRTILLTLDDTILINVLFWGFIICVIILLVMYFKLTKDDDSDDYHGHHPMLGPKGRRGL